MSPHKKEQGFISKYIFCCLSYKKKPKSNINKPPDISKSRQNIPNSRPKALKVYDVNDQKTGF